MGANRQVARLGQGARGGWSQAEMRHGHRRSQRPGVGSDCGRTEQRAKAREAKRLAAIAVAAGDAGREMREAQAERDELCGT